MCMAHNLIPEAPLGLYNPEDDRDACGVGFIAELDKVPTRACVVDAIEALRRMTHRGACGCEVNTGTPLADPLRARAGTCVSEKRQTRAYLLPVCSRSRRLARVLAVCYVG